MTSVAVDWCSVRFHGDRGCLVRARPLCSFFGPRIFSAAVTVIVAAVATASVLHGDLVYLLENKETGRQEN